MPSCPRNGTVRNVWRAPIPNPVSLLYPMIKIYNNSPASGHSCPPDHTVRNVWRAPPFHSVEPLGPLLWQLRPPRSPNATRRLQNGSAERPLGLPLPPRHALQTLLRHTGTYIETSSLVSSAGGGAMHMKCPDDIGREAGIGRTRNRNELSVFRACPW